MDLDDLKKLPEQTSGYPEMPFVWSSSREFRERIDNMPFYSGVLLEDGKTVHLSFLRCQGFEPEVPLRAYFMGELYAVITEKHRPLRVPEGMQDRIVQERQRVTQPVLTELASGVTTYSGSSEDLLRALQRADEEK